MRTLTQDVTETLRSWILHGRFPPGHRIEEIPTAEEMNVSRTPVRAALAALANEGLLNHQPKRGYVVRGFELAEVMAAYEVRAALEGLACRAAARRGIDASCVDTLYALLAQGDAILAQGELHPEDHEPYQKMNMALHDTLLEASFNPLLTRFVHQAQSIPYASDRIILWEDYRIIRHSHEDHHRIVNAVAERDETRAEQLMREHVYYSGVIFTRGLEPAPYRSDA